MGILYANDVHWMYVDAGRRLLKLIRHGGKRPASSQQQQNLGCILDHQVCMYLQGLPLPGLVPCSGWQAVLFRSSSFRT